MNKLAALILLGLCLSSVIAGSTNSTAAGSTVFLTNVAIPNGQTHVTLFDVWPAVDGQLKTLFWYYLRGANPLYEASIDSPLEYLFFTVYRNRVGTFLVSTSWNKSDQQTKVNSFVRLGNGYDSSANGKIYDPVLIDPFVVSIALGPNEFMETIDSHGNVVVTGNLTLYNMEKNANQTTNKFNVAADMAQKAVTVDKFNRDQYWYYLNNSTIIAQTSIATNEQYYFVFIYVNPIGTFLALSHWDLATKTAGINTLVRLGDGIPIGANFGPVNLSPSVLKIQTLN